MWIKGNNNFLLIICASACTVLNTHGKINATSWRNWISHLTNQIRRDPEVHQAIFLVDNDGNNGEGQEEKLVRKITRYVPTLKVRFPNATNENAHYLSQFASFKNARGTLFVIVPSSKNNESLDVSMQFLTQLSQSRRRPKCLFFIQDNRNATYDVLLRQMWTRQFLDVTILELVQSKAANKKNFRSFDKTVAKIHSYNPYYDTCTKAKYSRKRVLFPDKLRDLSGYQLKVGLFHYAPYASIIRNATGHVTAIAGPDVLTMNALSKALNFTLLKVISNETSWGNLRCDKESNTGLFKRLIRYEIQFLAVQCGRIACQNTPVEWSIGSWMIKYQALVPILPNQIPSKLNIWSFSNAAALAGLLLLVWLLSRLFRFDERNWRLMHIVQLTLGLPAPREPSRSLTERIVFGSLLLTCLLNSSFIYTAVTSFNIQKNVSLEINTIKDLVSSGLTPILQLNAYNYLVGSSEQDIQRLMSNAIVRNFSDWACVEYLITHKNITCIMRAIQAEMCIYASKKRDGCPTMKVVNEHIAMFPSFVALEAGSPYVDSFSQVINKLSEAGLSSKWSHMAQYNARDAHGTHSPINFINQGSEDSTQKRNILIFVLIVGYTSALLSFAAELLVGKYLKRN